MLQAWLVQLYPRQVRLVINIKILFCNPSYPLLDLWAALLGQDYSRYRPCGRPYWDKTTADAGPVGGLTGARLQQIQALWEALLGQDYSRYRTCGRPYWDKTTADAGPVGGLMGQDWDKTTADADTDLYSRYRPCGRPYWDKTTADGTIGTLQQIQALWEALLGHNYLWEALLGQDYSRCRTCGRPYWDTTTFGRPCWDKTTADAGPVGGLTGTQLPLGGLVGTRLQQMQEWCYPVPVQPVYVLLFQCKPTVVSKICWS